MGGLCGRMPRVALGLAPPLRVQVWEGFRAESSWRLLWVGTTLAGARAASGVANPPNTCFSMGDTGRQDGRDRNAKPPMLQGRFCGLCAACHALLWGWHHPCGCKFGRGLGRRAVGGCFGLAPPCECKGGKRRRESAKHVFQYGRYRAARWAALRRKMGEIGTQSRPCCKGRFCGLCAACHATSAELQQSGPPMGGAKL